MDILTWQARTEKNLTLIQLEELTGISKSTLNNIENGLVSPTIMQLETIAKSLDMKISELVQSDHMNYSTKKSDRVAAGFNFQDYGNGSDNQQNEKRLCYNSQVKGAVNMKYKEAIHSLVDKIHSTKQLKRIYKIVLYIYTHGGD